MQSNDFTLPMFNLSLAALAGSSGETTSNNFTLALFNLSWLELLIVIGVGVFVLSRLSRPQPITPAGVVDSVRERLGLKPRRRHRVRFWLLSGVFVLFGLLFFGLIGTRPTATRVQIVYQPQRVEQHHGESHAGGHGDGLIDVDSRAAVPAATPVATTTVPTNPAPPKNRIPTESARTDTIVVAVDDIPVSAVADLQNGSRRKAAPDRPATTPAVAAVAVPAAPVVPSSTAEPPLPTDDRTSTSTGAPDWVLQGPHALPLDAAHHHGDEQFIVLVSKQYATNAEAHEDVMRQVAEVALTDLKRFVSETWTRPVVLPPGHADRIVRARFVETIERDFGTFFAPMTREWVRIELSPSTREPALLMSRQSSKEGRVVMVVAGLAGLALLPILILARQAFVRRRTARYALSTKTVVIGLLIAGACLLLLGASSEGIRKP